MCIIWHKNCITSVACLPWYIVHEKMFSVALLAYYGNHETHFLGFFPICMCLHMHFKNHFILFFFHQRNILHGKDKCKHSFSLFFSFEVLTQKISCSYWLFMGVKCNRIMHGRYRFKIQWLHSLHISCLSLKSYFRICMK